MVAYTVSRIRRHDCLGGPTTAPSSGTVFPRDPGLDRDNSIWDAAIAALRSSGYRVLWGISCEVREGVVFLTGEVPSFYLKQMAQTVILGQTRVKGVKNRVEVRERG